jgi:hypothetical protein
MKHEDDHKNFADLTPWEQLNVRMDVVAKSFWQTGATINQFPAFSLPPTTEWSLWHAGQRLPCFDRKELLSIIWRPLAHTYWGKRLDIPNPQQCIAWSATASALKTHTPLPALMDT